MPAFDAIKSQNGKKLESYRPFPYICLLMPPRLLIGSYILAATAACLLLVLLDRARPVETGENGANFASVLTGIDGAYATIVSRIENPYHFAAPPIETLKAEARAALVNILCQTTGGPVKPISGSGVLIDPRGIILTNAHIAQYVLLSENGAFKLTCTIRTGSPARAAWKAAVLYIPPVWVSVHAPEINAPNPIGTGEHDYALLVVTDSVAEFPYLPFDTRERIGFTGDQVIAASYPVESTGPLATENDLITVLSPTTISQMLTFTARSVDLLSVDGIAEVQGGSSGGAVVNPWGRLIGLLVTASVTTTTAARDLHALTLNYIDRDMVKQTGKNISDFLDGDISAMLNNFNAMSLGPLLQQYSDFLN